MNASFLAFAIFLSITYGICADEYNVAAYCNLVKNGIKLGSVEECGTYYTCRNGKATKGTCPSNQSFDKNSQECKPKSQVNCFLENEQPCVERINGYVPIVGTCNGYTYCKDSVEVGQGKCPPNLIYYDQKCIEGTCSDNIYGEKKGGLTSVCQIMPNNMFFGSSVDCKTYQKCNKNQLSNGKCPDPYVFDVQSGICDYKSSTMCSRVTGKETVPNPSPTETCTAEQKNTQRANSRTCSTYEVCDGYEWVQRNCNTGQYFSETDYKCEARQTATPSSKCNRCEFSKNQFVNAVDPNCQRYQICNNGVYVGNGTCSSGYFDEAAQACILDENGTSTYAQKNGACLSCEAICGALRGSSCVTTLGCTCGLDSSKNCIECANVNCGGSVTPTTEATTIKESVVETTQKADTAKETTLKVDTTTETTKKADTAKETTLKVDTTTETTKKADTATETN